MTNAEYFKELLRDYMQFGRVLLHSDSLPTALFGSQAEVRIENIFPALQRTAESGVVWSPNLSFHRADSPTQVAAQLNLIAASRLRTLFGKQPSAELKESVYQDALYVFCLAYGAENGASFDAVVDEVRGKSVFLPPLPAAVA
jgi:hypothetical protein